MKDELNKLDAKVDRLDTRLDSIDKTLILNTEHLAQHMRRTTNLEERIIPLEQLSNITTALVKIGVAFGGVSAATLAILEIIKRVS